MNDSEVPPPAGLHAPKPTAPLDDAAIEVFAQLLAAGTEGLSLSEIRENLSAAVTADRVSAAAKELCHRGLARPQAMLSHYAPTALSWVTNEARLMAEARPGALDNWRPAWWAASTLDKLTEVLTPVVGTDLAPWVTAAIAGLELEDGKRW